ncbi:asparagine synthase [Sinorhizobium meliloti CCNWSX0020]|jgi:asparagine synthase (glutamine-hydrolysing)|uniref:asparagine synthase (glutamine-hydrolyzing) n=2 Tax=Sinorhizobium TaxID=28105 RepID=H0FUS9_RHIML|nr:MULTISPECIES: asparagine synthase (glutamine-hydrolyzing) [Sinorhizobium]EHK79264.1 asparagine synthase [Sinorhizobium meliloti CCNWSX0020]RVG75116.1 asparagine synthase (glutamine-hydrolyzing) [Sinorhizobium meliloti]RVH38393.1 asparagine synthase (glutamine-hydrolyzing) [Sinorhizobium meliloti]WHS91958.1 asparagine synthase (glutamine-hydrolyzing) [Sinorhizobium kummerowiae]WRW48159.1 asparagine synthase (glutamine-hydrolyzing) [Sinorhizobium kummerowiae]
MCGFGGYLGSIRDGKPLLERMTAAIGHRGPDERGIFTAPGAGLGHVRLSIVGLGDGQQPMSDPSGELTIAFNGEIFNYVELRDELRARGRRFRTSSDTEVILHLYEEMGEDCLSLLNGDFAFAIWDARRRRMMLARDRMGVRPLFHTLKGGTLYFASEVKALLEVPGVSAEIDPIALDQIFTLWAPIAPRTPFRDIHELEPGHLMIADQNGTTTRPYWQLDYPDRDERPAYAEESRAAEELRALLTDATRIRMRADVPVGAYLSGGLDSSIISALAAGMTAQGLRTFSVTFDSAEHDESAFQEEMAAALGTEHRAVACRAGDIARDFPDVIRFTEKPIIRTAPAPLYKLSGLVREAGLKVVLTGEGADEVFAGYDIFKEARVRRFCGRQPGSRIRPHLFRKLYPYLPGLQQQSAEYLAAFFGAGDVALDDPLFSHRPRLKGTAATKMFFSSDLRAELKGYDAAEELVSRLPAAFGRWHPLHQAQYLESRFLLPGYILSSQGDRMAMAHGIEGRFPFLDHRLVEFAAKLPPEMKLRGLVEKHILREATKDLLPPAIGRRTKQPYRAPDSHSFSGAGELDYVRSAMSEDAVTAGGLFNAKAVTKLYQKCQSRPASGFRDNAAFVGVLSTQLWLQTFTGTSLRKAEAA